MAKLRSADPNGQERPRSDQGGVRSLSVVSPEDAPSEKRPELLTEPAAEPPATIPMTLAILSPNNDQFLTNILREIREEALRAQQRRMDGRMVIEINVSSGNLRDGTVSMKRLVGFGR